MSKNMDRVRDLYGMATAWNSHDTRPHVVRIRERNYAEFDTMIAEVKADAWDEGWNAGASWPQDDTNPYRKQEEA